MKDQIVSGEKRRLEFLDCLRGIAALMVVYLHVAHDSIAFLGLKSGWEYHAMYVSTFVADFGKIGVVLFFAISGFIIPVSFRASRRPAVLFVLSRFFRLYPAYWVSLIVGLLALWFWHGQHVPWGEVLANVTMVQSALGQPDVLGVYWTLFIEWLFYVFCLAAFLAGRLGKTRFSFNAALWMLALALCSAGARYVTHRKVPVALASALSIMCFASVWRNYLIDRDVTAGKLAIAYLGVFTLIFPLIALLGYNFDTGFDETWYRYSISYLIGIGMFLLFTGVWRLKAGWLLWLGSISYSLYLLHPIVVMGLERFHGNKLPWGSAHLLFLESLVLSLVIADLCYRRIERPAIRLGQTARLWILNESVLSEQATIAMRTTSV